MKTKTLHIKNSYAAIALHTKDIRQGLLLGQKITLHRHPSWSQTTDHKAPSSHLKKQSTFAQLKNQIKCLQNSEFLSLKYPSRTLATQPDQSLGISAAIFKRIGRKFIPNKSKPNLQRFKMHPNRKSRRLSQLLTTSSTKIESLNRTLCVNPHSLSSKDLNVDTRVQPHVHKKKNTPNIVKKYYRPLSCTNRLQYLLHDNEIHCSKLKTSVSHRRHQKQNSTLLIF